MNSNSTPKCVSAAGNGFARTSKRTESEANAAKQDWLWEERKSVYRSGTASRLTLPGFTVAHSEEQS
jgi:hypothetical protein